MREKLIELLTEPTPIVDSTPGDEFAPKMKMGLIFAEKVADRLIANDVVPVVRCKDCKHWMYEYDDVGLCVTDVPDIDGVQRRACDFCSYGERRTDERKADGID